MPRWMTPAAVVGLIGAAGLLGVMLLFAIEAMWLPRAAHFVNHRVMLAAFLIGTPCVIGLGIVAARRHVYVIGAALERQGLRWTDAPADVGDEMARGPFDGLFGTSLRVLGWGEIEGRRVWVGWVVWGTGRGSCRMSIAAVTTKRTIRSQRFPAEEAGIVSRIVRGVIPFPARSNASRTILAERYAEMMLDRGDATDENTREVMTRLIDGDTAITNGVFVFLQRDDTWAKAVMRGTLISRAITIAEGMEQRAGPN